MKSERETWNEFCDLMRIAKNAVKSAKTPAEKRNAQKFIWDLIKQRNAACPMLSQVNK
jgi:hypothetical protein